MQIEGALIYVTGVAGFVGLRLAERAIERGASVAGLQRTPEGAKRAAAVGADVTVGDITDPPDAIAPAMQGADVVVHTAAIVAEGGRLEEFRRVNVAGAVNVANAARTAGVPLVVHLSSIMVHGFEFPDQVTEDGPRRGEGSPYCQTKIEGEDAVFALHDPPSLGVIIVRPGDVYGPGSVPWVKRPVQLMRKRVFALPGGGEGIINHVHVDNLIDGIFLAIEQEAVGETFTFTDGRATTCADYFGLLADAAGVSPPRTVPAWVMRAAVRLQSGMHRVRGKEPEAGPDAVRYLLRPHAYSIGKARTVLGYEPRITLEEGMADLAETLRRRNLKPERNDHS